MGMIASCEDDCKQIRFWLFAVSRLNLQKNWQMEESRGCQSLVACELPAERLQSQIPPTGV